MKKVKVDNSTCIGCGACVSIDPDDFKFVDGYSAAKNETVQNEDKAKEAEESCPVSAITIEDAGEEKKAA